MKASSAKAKTAYDKLDAALSKSKAAYIAAGKKIGNKIVEPKGQKAALTVESLVMNQFAPLFSPVKVQYKSTQAEFFAFMKTVTGEVKFWKALVKEVKADAKKKNLVPGANKFIAANKKLK